MTRTTTYTTTEGTTPNPEEQHMARTIERSEHGELYAMLAEIGDGIFVAWDTCFSCHEHVTQCSCKSGPVEPPYIKQWRVDRFEKSFSDRGALPRLPQQLRSTDAVRNKVLRELLDEGYTVVRPGTPVTQADLTVESLDSGDENLEDHRATKPSLAEVVARAQNSSATDPTWRTDYSQEETS